MSLRIQVSTATVKALHTRLQQAYLKDDRRLVRRTTVLLDLLVHHVPMATLCERWGLSPSCLYDGQRAFRLHGMESLPSRHKPGQRIVYISAEISDCVCSLQLLPYQHLALTYWKPHVASTCPSYSSK